MGALGELEAEEPTCWRFSMELSIGFLNSWGDTTGYHHFGKLPP